MFYYGVHLNLITVIFCLWGVHFLADFPWQNDFLAKAKDPTNPANQGGVWQWCLFAHAMIHGFLVFILVHSMVIALLEVALHALIDFTKCYKKISFTVDQVLHLACKVVYACFFVYGLS